MSSSHITPKISILSTFCVVIKFLHLLLRELTLFVSLVTDSEEVLIKKMLSGHRSLCLPLNPAQVPTSPTYQPKGRKHTSSQGKLKSIQVFIRIDLGCVLRRPGAPTSNLVLPMATQCIKFSTGKSSD